ncbi:uncharacterized protein LOC141859247 [Acropora palmata]|uniref:uncharacterized protein LOC141859247 n=1 Tax=Acropora palmata TaxID=6131 RepID=UPI003DA196D0
MESRGKFRLKLTEVASELDVEKLTRLKYLCSDTIPAGDLEKIKTPEQLFLELEQRKTIEPNRLKFLIDCLDGVGRKDLAADLRSYERKRTEGGAEVPSGLSPLQGFIEKAEYYNNRGKVEFQESRFENACQQFTSALKCLPSNLEKDDQRNKYLCNRAACYLKLRKFKDAQEDCDSVLLRNPHLTKARYRLAQSLDGQGKTAEAFTEVTSLLRVNPESMEIGQLEFSLKRKIEDSKQKAMEKQRQGQQYYRKSNFKAAIIEFSEGKLLLPQLDIYKEEMKQFYLWLAKCHLRKGHAEENNLEAALRQCEEADRLVPDDLNVLYTKMKVLERMKRHKECYAVCNKLIQSNFKESEAKKTSQRVLPKIVMEDEALATKEQGKPELPRSPEVALAKKSKKGRAKKGSNRQKEKKTNEGTLEGGQPPSVDDNVEPIYSNTTDTRSSLPVAGDAVAEEGAGTSLTSCEDVTQGSLRSRRTTRIRDTPLSKSGLEGNDLLEKTRERDRLETKAEYHLSQVQDKDVLDKSQPSVSTNLNNISTDSIPGGKVSGEAYPRRILLISERWSSWQRSVCTVNRQLSRSFARNEDIYVACLVLHASEQETIAAKRDGVNLIKASIQPGLCEGDEHLLQLHCYFPFKVDLIVGHGIISGTAAAIQANRLDCKRLHVFHNLPGEEQERERDLGLNADFVAGIGPLVVEQWQAILNREVITIIPGLPEVAPRNKIMTPQTRCLVLGDFNNPNTNGLKLVAAALANCKRRKHCIHLTVVGTDREMVRELKEEISKDLRYSRVQVEVKRFDLSQEAIGVEIRGVSLVLMPSSSDGFGVLSLEAMAAKVPVLIASSSGVAKFLHKEWEQQFLKLLCSTDSDTDCEEAWKNAIDGVIDDREDAFGMAESLWDKWSSVFTWDSAADNVLKRMSSFGVFSAPSPSADLQITLPSQCSVSALNFMQHEVDLLNRRRKHVLLVSPENATESPFIRYFAQVPWIAVLDFDVNSVKTGYLASCGTFCENMGMKICRILPPSPGEDRKKFPGGSLTGIPWVLLEGMPESKRNVKGNLEWMREFFSALSGTHQVPITFTVLWKSLKETETLCKSLSKILTAVQLSPLYNQVKLVIASTGDSVSSYLEDIAEEWGVDVQSINLEDICNALCQCVNSSPFIPEDQNFSLPVADPNDPQKVGFKVLPGHSRWINAEVEVLFQSVGSTPQFETDDAYHFYRGGLISWYALQMGYAVERGNWKALKKKVDELLVRAGTLKLRLPHQRGTGGSTSARKILFDYHEKYPCVFLKSVGHAEVAQAIKVVAEFCRLPVIVLVDCKQVQSDEFDLDTLYNILSNDRIPCVVLEVIHQSQIKAKMPSQSSENRSEKTPPFRLADTLDSLEANQFVEMYSTQRKDKLGKLCSLRDRGLKQLQIPFYYALTTFEDRFTALEPFVEDCLRDVNLIEQKILLFLAMAFHYGHNSLSATEFAELLQAPRREVISLELLLPELSQELLLEEDGKWSPRHDLIALEMLRRLLTLTSSSGPAPIHLDNWKNQLAEKALDFFEHMSEGVVSDVLLSRIVDDSSYQYLSFSQLISDIPIDDDAVKVFEKAISLFPDNPFFKVHLGRFYSIQKRSAGFSMAIKYTDDGIWCSQDYSRLARGQLVQMKGIVYSREVNHLVEHEAEIERVIEMAHEGVNNFRRAVSIAPDFVDGYIPEVRMMCRVFEYIDHKTGDFCDYVKSADAHPFIIDGICNTSNTLECVPDSDEYAHWRMRLACLGRRNFSSRKVKETLDLLYLLRTSGRASRGSINRQIVVMKVDMCSNNGESLSMIAPEMMELLNEALRYDGNIEHTMRLWVRLAPFIPVSLAEAESKIFFWSSKEKSVRSCLYKFIIACLHLLEGGSSTYSEIMKNAKEDLISGIKAINRPDVGRCRHPDRPVVWLGQKGKGMGHLVNLDDMISEFKYVRTTRFIDGLYTKQLRALTGLIVKTGAEVGTIKTGELEVSFRTDLCTTSLTSSAFANRKVKFFLAFTFFGTDAYNVKLVAE